MTPTSSWSARAVAHVAAASSGGALDRSLRVTLNFHPDRVLDGANVLECLARDGVYRSQFETGTSNGGLTAHPGGDRWRWEQRIFGDAYDDAPAAQRPKYGALNHRRRPIGGAPRFGSSHLRLKESVLDRSTFCFPDSTFDPTAMGTAERFDLIQLADGQGHGVLDDYVEAHVHGTVRLDTDVEALVLDPCFRGTEVADQAHTLGVPVEWHEGRRLPIDVLERHPDLRGPRIVDVGRRIAAAGVLDAAVIGRAALRGDEDPQDLKKVWHCVAALGAPASS
ncbi:DUF3626 domain-containing protein [Nocardioides lacusdianchii]|uniref:DUF3626 domain-containing protein n=1 Tax=Nocardioides lacusdianchii TaxID=2783664 RepID=UPI001CD0162B|nr:DUF3626 domain-containing protein [Nocardioides lacusdianchii]